MKAVCDTCGRAATGSMDNMIQVTNKQNEYLLQLADGPKTTRDLMLSQMISLNSVGNMIRKLRKAGLVRSSKKRGVVGNIHEHKLIRSYQELKDDLEIGNTKNAGVPHVEVLYVAILRNGCMTGQELINQHLKVFPGRAKYGVTNIVSKAKAQGLCR